VLSAGLHFYKRGSGDQVMSVKLRSMQRHWLFTATCGGEPKYYVRRNFCSLYRGVTVLCALSWWMKLYC